MAPDHLAGHRKVFGPPPSPKGWRLKDDSLSRLWILFPHRAKGVVLYSRDWTHKRSRVRLQELGIRRLERWMLQPGNNCICARIYDSDGTLLYRYKNGNRV